jgi:hypothetical protein
VSGRLEAFGMNVHLCPPTSMLSPSCRMPGEIFSFFAEIRERLI